jgi:hypothetical protein
MRNFVLLLLLAGAHSGAAEERVGAQFKEGVGVTLPALTKTAIGLELADVEERAVSNDMWITAQVYREAREPSQNEDEPGGFAYASAWIEGALADALPPGTEVAVEGHPEAVGSVLRADRTVAAQGGRVELLLQLHDREHRWRIGEFIRVSLRGLVREAATVIPASAVLDTAYGAFAYVVNGDAYLRTAIQTGARHEDVVEITDGLFIGDAVVVRPVETLYHIELRATKGGGHSH